MSNAWLVSPQNAPFDVGMRGERYPSMTHMVTLVFSFPQNFAPQSVFERLIVRSTIREQKGVCLAAVRHPVLHKQVYTAVLISFLRAVSSKA